MKMKLACSQVPNMNGELNLLKATGHVQQDTQWSLTEKGEKTLINLESLFRKVKPATPEEILGPEYLKQIQTYREQFPNGKRATKDEVLNKFVKLFNKFPDLKWELIQKATRLYHSEPRDFTYTMKAGNFIMVQRGGDTSYNLMEYYERVSEGEEALESMEIDVE